MGRWIPGFVFRFFSRILRIDFFNDHILYSHGYKINVDFARASIEELNVTLEVLGREHLPPDGRFIFVANHPLGGFDGMMIISEISRSFSNLKVLANTRKFLGIKANLEMFFLPNESYKHRNKHFVITFGKPIPFSTFDKRHRPVEWAALVKDNTYTLAENPESEFSAINKQVSWT